MTDPIEETAVTVIPQPSSSALVATGPQAVGIFELGAMDQATYERQVGVIKLGLERVKSLMRDLLVPERDYLDFANVGAKPGDKKRDERVGLLKSGAEALATFFHLVPQFSHEVTVTTFATGPASEWRPDRIDVDTTVLVHYGSVDGPVVGEGSGSATSWETKYHWRDDKPVCPQCGKDLRLSKDKPEFYCWQKVGGCGATFPKDSIAAPQGRIENPEPHELRNTLIKMSAKRAWTDGVIRTLNASSLFTQDMEDRPHAAQQRPVDDRDAVQWSDEAQDEPTLASEPATWTGKVMEPSDGVRQDASGRSVVKFTMKVGNAKHHVIVVGPMASRVYELGPEPDEPVAVVGVKRLVPWGDGSKPAMKHIEDVTRVAVKREGQWFVIEEGGAPADPPPSPTGTASTETGAPSGESTPDPNSPAATGTSETPGTAADPSSASTSGSDSIPDEAREGYPTLLAAAIAQGQPAHGHKGDPCKEFGIVGTQEWTGEKSGKPSVAMRVLGDDGLVYQCAVPEFVGHSQLEKEEGGGWRFAIGDRVRIIGTWATDSIVVLTGVIRAAQEARQ